jgi:hypothetical protein
MSIIIFAILFVIYKRKQSVLAFWDKNMFLWWHDNKNWYNNLVDLKSSVELVFLCML